MKKTADIETRKRGALAKHLGCRIKDVEVTEYDESLFDAEGSEYLVLTDTEADERATEYIRENLWAFNPSFLASFTDLPEEVFTAMQPRCEDANEAILKLVKRSDGGLDALVSEAISADGRGHFLSNYDGEENESDNGEFFIYRQ